MQYAGAGTAVGDAESEPNIAMRINGEALGIMAEDAMRIGVAMFHYSSAYRRTGRVGFGYAKNKCS